MGGGNRRRTEEEEEDSLYHKNFYLILLFEDVFRSSVRKLRTVGCASMLIADSVAKLIETHVLPLPPIRAGLTSLLAIHNFNELAALIRLADKVGKKSRRVHQRVENSSQILVMERLRALIFDELRL